MAWKYSSPNIHTLLLFFALICCLLIHYIAAQTYLLVQTLYFAADIKPNIYTHITSLVGPFPHLKYSIYWSKQV